MIPCRGGHSKKILIKLNQGAVTAAAGLHFVGKSGTEDKKNPITTEIITEMLTLIFRLTSHFQLLKLRVWKSGKKIPNLSSFGSCLVWFIFKKRK